jgi:hypothetical protein
MREKNQEFCQSRIHQLAIESVQSGFQHPTGRGTTVTGLTKQEKEWLKLREDHFRIHREAFYMFVANIKEFKDEADAPSLKLGKQTQDSIDFTWLGRSYRIKHEIKYSDQWSDLVIITKEPETGKNTETCKFKLDQNGEFQFCGTRTIK